MKEAIRFSGAPVDFEEIGVNRESTPAELENALLALSRNGVGLKGAFESLGIFVNITSYARFMLIEVSLFLFC